MVDLSLRAAGADALLVNAPMGADRLASTVEWLAGTGPVDVLDLGCGRGGMAVAVAQALPPGARVTGVDTDAGAISRAQSQAAAAGLAERCSFLVGDAAAWDHPADATVCVAAAHAFGGAEPTLLRLWDLTRPGGAALLGDGVWAADPDDWCIETFGELPDIDRLAALARQAGWVVEDVETSTATEWDGFEATWLAGVEAVGTEAARTFAAERREEYRRYRGVLGFAWLRLRRPA